MERLAVQKYYFHLIRQAIQCSSYFDELYRFHKARGKKSSPAIVIVARRLCEIAWHLLTEDRPYEERPVRLIRIFPGRSVSKVIELVC